MLCVTKVDDMVDDCDDGDDGDDDNEVNYIYTSKCYTF